LPTPSLLACCSTLTPLAASVCIDDRSSSAHDSTSTSLAVSLSAQLRCLLDA
jgi:hypothetical protein